MAKNPNGAGSVIYDAARKKYRAYCTTPAGRRISKRFETRKEAQEWVALNCVAIMNHSFIEPSDMTLGSWLITYLRDYKAQTIAPKTMDLYTLLASKCQPLTDEKLQTISVPMIQSFYTDLLQRQSVEMVRKLHAFLHAAFEKARQIGLLSNNVITAAEPPKTNRKREIQTFAPEEVKAIYETAKIYAGGKYYPLVSLAFSSGARLGELLGLYWDCIDFDNDEITIKRNLTVTHTAGIHVGNPKTKAGTRTISVPHAVLTLLKDLPSPSNIVRITGPVFVTRTGTPYQPRNIERIWHNIVKRANIPYRNFHVIRHTHATELLAAGAPIADVSRRIGHSKISHTLDLYGHAVPRMDKIISQKVSLIFS